MSYTFDGKQKDIMEENNKTCFIIMPISTPDSFLDKYRDGSDHFKHVLECLFIPSVEAAGFRAISPIGKGSDLIHAEIINNLELADLVLCDMSCLNPNVFFEYGIRTSLNKPVCVVKDEFTNKVPFDSGIINYQEYKGSFEPWNLPGEIKKLAEHLKTSEERSKGENKLWKYFGLRSKAKPYESENNTDAKIDYLSMQMDSFRQQLDNIQRPIQRPIQLCTFPPVKQVEDDLLFELIKFISSHLPKENFMSSMSGDAVNGFTLTYRGHLPILSQATIQRLVKNKFNVELYFEKGDFEHPNKTPIKSE
jgi:hypothetical protein